VRSKQAYGTLQHEQRATEASSDAECIGGKEGYTCIVRYARVEKAGVSELRSELSRGPGTRLAG